MPRFDQPLDPSTDAQGVLLWYAQHERPLLSDTGNAERLAELTIDYLRYVEDGADRLGWRRYRPSSGVWEDVSEETYVMEQTTRLAEDYKADARELYALADVHKHDVPTVVTIGQPVIIVGGKQQLEKLADRLWAMAEKVESMSKRRNAVAGLKAVHGVRIDGSEFDTDPLILNTPTGVLDMHHLNPGGSFSVHVPDPLNFVTKTTRGRYIPPSQRGPEFEALYDEWISLLRDDWHVPEDQIKYLQTYEGKSLDGDLPKQVVPLIGPKFSGKSSYQNAIAFALGSYAERFDPDMFETGKSVVQSGEMLAKLRGVRRGLGGEPRVEMKFSSENLKRFTGEQEVSIQQKNKAEVTIKVTASLSIAMNRLPVIDAEDGAAWERLHFVSFPRTIPASERKTDAWLKRKLERLADAILTWAVEGRIELLNSSDGADLRHPEPTATMRIESEMERFEQDELAHWWRDDQSYVDVDDEESAVRIKELHNAYTAWREQQLLNNRRPDEKQKSLSAMRQWFQDRGYEVPRPRAGNPDREYFVKKIAMTAQSAGDVDLSDLGAEYRRAQ